MFITAKREKRIILAGFKAGQFIERSEMMHYLVGRKSELLECGKTDSCIDLALFIDSIIEDLHEKVKEEN